MEALSDSTMIKPVSTAITSPTLTITSITATSLKSPMSGTFTSTRLVIATRSSEKHAPQIGEQFGEMDVEPRSGGAVYYAMVPGQRQRQRQARRPVLAVTGVLFPVALADPHDGHLGGVDDGGEVDAADPAQRTDREGATLHLLGFEFALARQLGQFAHLPGDLRHALL